MMIPFSRALILLVVALAGASAQTHHFVGGDDGFVPQTNVKDWITGRVFRVGDKLWFRSSGGPEAVLELRGAEEYEACDLSNPIKMYTDNVDLEEKGVRYFVSRNIEHCKNGLKLAVPVDSDAELYDPEWPEPDHPSPGYEPVDPGHAPPDPFEPVKPDLTPPHPDWPAPPERYEPPYGPYEPPIEPKYPPPAGPSGAATTTETAVAVTAVLGLLISCVM